MEGGKGVDIKKNVAKWKELAWEAIAESGSSDLNNIQEFVLSLTCKSSPNELEPKQNGRLMRGSIMWFSRPLFFFFFLFVFLF